jgi:hypothetical protein
VSASTKRASTKRPAARGAKTKTAAKAPAKVPKKSGTRRGAPKRTAAARKAAARAKDAGAIGPWGSTAQRGLRDLGIVAGMAAGAGVQEVASEFGVSVKTVREVCQRREARPSLLNAKPMEILEGFLGETRDTLDLLRAAAAGAVVSNNLPVLVGAAKAELLARRELMELMVAVGLMPRDLELFHAEHVLRSIADSMVAVIGKLEAGQIDAAEAGAVFRSLVADPEAQRRHQLPA